MKVAQVKFPPQFIKEALIRKMQVHSKLADPSRILQNQRRNYDKRVETRLKSPAITIEAKTRLQHHFQTQRKNKKISLPKSKTSAVVSPLSPRMQSPKITLKLKSRWHHHLGPVD